ncbi:MAG: sigma-54 interaction domain-containing protein [Anaerovoracaceae bacterium]
MHNIEWFNDPASLYLTILDNTLGQFWVTDETGHVLFVNKETCSILNIDKSDVLGKSTEELQSAGIIERSVVKEIIKTQKPVITSLKTVTDTELSMYGIPVFDDSGKLIMAIAYNLKTSVLEDFQQAMKEERDRLRELISNDWLALNGQKYHIIYNSTYMQEIISILDTISPTDVTILLTGPSGSGKEVMARYIHSTSNRRDELFIPLNCAAIPKELMESEFFGYEKGAFTGAVSTGKQGYFELANNGTIFLDEVAELDLSLQAKLLRVLETGEYNKVGEGKIRKTNARILAATNRDLKELIKQGKFRDDLFYRLDIFNISIPPLKDRRDEIIPLAEYYLDVYNQKYGTHRYFDENTLKNMQSYEWPGNIRELKNTIQRLVVISKTDRLNLNVPVSPEATHDFIPSAGSSLVDMVDNYEKKCIEQALKAFNGSVYSAAKALSITPSGLYKKMKKHNINF